MIPEAVRKGGYHEVEWNVSDGRSWHCRPNGNTSEIRSTPRLSLRASDDTSELLQKPGFAFYEACTARYFLLSILSRCLRRGLPIV
jgi:hypothetical protein